MTPDGIKRLHYKTIIFPINSHPIFRVTVVYNKFQCYQQGGVKRKMKVLIELSDTYFTVENLKISNTDSNEEILEEQQNYDKNLLNDAKEIYMIIFKGCTDKIQYINNRLVMYFFVTENITDGEKFLLDNRISKDKYHIEFTKYEDKIIIEIYLKVY